MITDNMGNIVVDTTLEMANFDLPVLLGCAYNSSNGRQRYFNGTIHACEIYNYVMSDEELLAKISD